MFPKYLKKDGDSVVFDGKGSLKMYIPQKQFDLNIATFSGKICNYFGIVPYCVEDEHGKKSKLHKINCPTLLQCVPSSIETIRDAKLTKYSHNQDYKILIFEKGAKVILSTAVPKNVANAEKLINLFIITGNIPETIPYDQIQDYIEENMKLNGYIEENMKLNGNSYNVPLQLWGVIVSECCRSRKDKAIPFRLSGSKDMYDYDSISVKNVSKMVSAFSAFQSENFDDSVIHAMTNSNAITSPLEKVLTNGF